MKQLTSRERLDRCYRKREVDRPGLYVRGVGAQHPRHPSYAPLRELVLAQGDLKGGWRYEHLVEPVPSSDSTEPYSEDFERRITMVHTPAGDLRSVYLVGLKGQPGFREEYLIKTPEDAERYLSLPVPRVDGETDSFFEIVKEVGERGIVEVGTGLNPAGFVADLLGSTLFALFTIEHRDLLHALMRQRRDKMLHILKYVLSRNVGPYYAMLGQEYVTPPLHGPQDFYDFNVQYDRPIADLIHDAGGLLHVHSHGPVKDVLPAFIELGADVLHPLEAPPLGDVTPKIAKEALRGKVCIEGNVQIGDMYTLTADEIRQQVEDLIRDAFDDHAGLIVCPTASPYIPEMSQQCYENYAALVDTVVNWRAG